MPRWRRSSGRMPRWPARSTPSWKCPRGSSSSTTSPAPPYPRCSGPLWRIGPSEGRQMKKIFHVLPLVFLVVILSHSTSHAIEMEYYTYNGFNAVVSAFTKIALIFSDADYKGLFFTVIVLGILMGGVVVYFIALSGGRVTPLSWTWPVGIGITLYLALVLPKGTLHIYDPVKNQYQPVRSEEHT